MIHQACSPFETLREPMPAHIRYPSIRSVLQQPNSIPSFDVLMSSGEDIQEPKNTTMDTAEGEPEVWDDDEPREMHGYPIDDSDSDNETNVEGREEGSEKAKRGLFMFPPTIEQAQKRFDDLANILKPRRNKGPGFTDPGLDKIVTERLSAMKLFCFNYIDMSKKHTAKPQWQAASLQTAQSLGRNTYMARTLREWTREFINNPEFVPEHHHKGRTGQSHIDDEDFAQELHLHLQSIGEYCTTDHIIQYVARSEILAKLNRTKTISHATAHRWIKKMGYRWQLCPHGQYVDGHERADVVEYCEKIFLPAIKGLESKMRKWGHDGKEEDSPENGRRTVFWFHDESTFYAHDRKKKRWVHNSEKAKPYAKGEGHSLMVADFVSADYGWL